MCGGAGWGGGYKIRCLLFNLIRREGLSMRKIRFEIIGTGAPYPHDSYWQLKGSNGRILCQSDKMGARNARKTIDKLIKNIKSGNFDIKEIPFYKTKNKKSSRGIFS